MRRREFVAGIGSAAAWPLRARAQQQPKIRHVGIIDDTPQWNAFRSRLRELGYLEGEHIAFDYASGDGNPERLAEAAAQAISRRSIKSALRSYCSSVHYLTTSMEGAMRINLTGEPAGTVTATEARYATERLAVLAKVTAKRASKVASTSTGAQTSRGSGTESRRTATPTPKVTNISNRTLATEPTPPGPKRLSLSDLKRAAAARKAMR